MTHQSFVEFMEEAVVPARAANPTHRRLDGQPTGGNWAVFGEFRHRGKRWKVHADTHYEPLLVAYKAAKAGADPFVEAPTQSGLSLALTDDLRAKLSQQRYKYVYIYEMPSDAGDVEVLVKGGGVRQTEGDVRFVQFPHPGAEHRMPASGRRPWKLASDPHARTFLESPGTYRTTAEGPDEHGSVAFFAPA